MAFSNHQTDHDKRRKKRHIMSRVGAHLDAIQCSEAASNCQVDPEYLAFTVDDIDVLGVSILGPGSSVSDSAALQHEIHYGATINQLDNQDLDVNVSFGTGSDYEGSHTDQSDSELDDSESLSNRSVPDNLNSSDTDLSDIDNGEGLRNKLTEWGVDVVHSKVSSLLKILKPLHPNLPLDARTLLGTQTQYETKQIAGGSYHHFGIQKAVQNAINNSDSSVKTALSEGVTLGMQVNIDGLPIFKSSNVQFWPMLARLIPPIKTKVFTIGLFSGSEKPKNVDEYLHDFVAEMNSIENGGICISSVNCSLEVSCFICDAPARAFVKQVKGHSGYYGCEKCIQKGEWEGKLTFPLLHSELRSDTLFREHFYAAHQTGFSPLTTLSMGMVSQFPLDYMHLVCLGVMKRLLWLWTRAPRRRNSKLSAGQIQQISARLLLFHVHLPSEFQRKCRSLSELERWKATEYRQFLLYVGLVALKGNISDANFRHFLLLHVSISCLASETYWRTHTRYAGNLLKYFVQQFGVIYGKDQLVYTVHNLVHLDSDVERFRPLDNFSAFPFESFLGQLKRKIRKPELPLPQIIRRLSELENANTCEETKRFDQPRPKNNIGYVPRYYQDWAPFKSIFHNGYKLSSESGDNCLQIDNKVVVVHNILVGNDGEKKVVVKSFRTKVDFFTYPINSSDLGIVKVSHLRHHHEVVSLPNHAKKLALLPYKDTFIAFPLLHQC